MAITIRGVVSETARFDGPQYARVYTIVYRVIATELEGAVQIETAVATLLRIGEGSVTGSLVALSRVGHPLDQQAKVTSLHAERPDQDCPEVWTCTVEFSTKAVDPDRQEANSTENPLNRPPVVRWGEAKISKPFTKGYDLITDDSGILTLVTSDGQPHYIDVVSSNDEPFDPTPDQERFNTLLTITRNEAPYSYAAAKVYRDTVNAAAILGAAAGECRMRSITAERGYEKGVVFSVVTYVIEIQDGGWGVPLLNCGSYFYTGLTFNPDGSRDTTDAKKVPFSDTAGNPLRNRLDEFGQPLALGNDPTYSTFYPCRPKDWTPLDLVV